VIKFKLPINNKIRGVLIVIAGVTGGYICDKHFKNQYPIFTIVLPIMALMIAFALNKQLNKDEDTDIDMWYSYRNCPFLLK